MVDQSCEYVYIPPMDSLVASRAAYWSRDPFINLNGIGARAFRVRLIESVVDVFSPDVIITDYFPLGKGREIAAILSRSPASKVFLMRGVMDTLSIANQEIFGDKEQQALREQYQAILVACDRRICDPTTEYVLDPQISAKIEYIGYVSRQSESSEISEARVARGVPNGFAWVVCSGGGGARSGDLVAQYLELPQRFPEVFFDIVAGPRYRGKIKPTAGDSKTEAKVRISTERNDLPLLHASADVVVCPGGYNSIVETLEGEAKLICAPPPLQEDAEPDIHIRRLGGIIPLQRIDHPREVHAALHEALQSSVNPESRKNLLDLDGIRRAGEAILKVARAKKNTFSEN